MNNIEGRIQWTQSVRPTYEGRFSLAIPEESWRELYLNQRELLAGLLGCEECPLFMTYPPYTDYAIVPEFGRKEEADDGEIVVQVGCEGLKKEAGEQAACMGRYEEETDVIMNSGS